MNSKIIIFFLALISIMASNLSNYAQSVSPEEKMLALLDNGSITGNVYENKMLGLRIKFPKSMEVDNRAEIESELKEAIALMRNEKSVDQKRVDEMIRKDRIVFAVNIPQTDDSLGASLNLTIKKDETSEELIPMVDRTVKFFLESKIYKLEKAVSTEICGGISFTTFTFSMDVEGERVYSKNYAARRKGHLLTFVLAYVDEKEFKNMELVMKGIEGF